jgi:uncharacterized protein (TIGR00251 family)
MKRIEDTADGRMSFSVDLVPRASRDAVVGWSDGGRLKIRVTAPPVEEAANRALIKILSKLLGVAKSDVFIAAGVHSRTKRIVVPASCKNRLSSIADI